MRPTNPPCETTDETDLAGHVVGDKWRLEARIGRGSFGEVWSARHVVTGGQRALKLLDAAMSAVPDLRQRFVREAQAASRIESPHVVSIDDIGFDDTLARSYLIMELLRGETLHEYLARAPYRMAVGEALFVLSHIASALDAAHRVGVVHRDLKPDNVALTFLPDGTVRAKLLDFGIAKLTDQWTGRYVALDARTLHGGGRTAGFLGTPGYCAPEQIRDASRVGAAADIFSFGICAFEMLTATSYWQSSAVNALLLEIFQGPTHKASRRTPDGVVLPAAFDDWFARVCADEPERRFSSAGDAYRALAEVFPTECATPPVRRTSAAQSTPSGANRPRRRSVSLAATLPGRTAVAASDLARLALCAKWRFPRAVAAAR